MTATSALASLPPTGGAPAQLVDGRYRLGNVLGTGGAAVVRRAVDERLRRAVALKLFHPGVTEPERQAGELSIMAGLAHPSLVRMYDGGVCVDANGAEYTYLALELVDGETLRAELGRGPLAPDRVAAIGADLGAAIGYLHDRGIVHRDVKPANVLLPADGQVRAKLGDFGVARLLDGARVTATGLTVGTANYLSPEQVRGEHVGPASDVWSLGLILLESLTGSVEYEGTGVAAATARLTRPPVIPQRLGPDWTRLLESMLAADPAHRPSGGAVSAALSGTGQVAPPVVAPAAPTAAGAPTRAFGGLHRAEGPGPGTAVLVRRRRLSPVTAVLGGLGAVCVLAILAVLLVSALATGTAPTAPAAPAGGDAGPSGPAPASARGASGTAASSPTRPAGSANTVPASVESPVAVARVHGKALGHTKSAGKGRGRGDGNGDDNG